MATRSRGGAAGRPKQATLEDFDVGGTTTTTGSSRKAQRARSAAGESKEKKATTVTKSSSSPSAATAANANTTAQPSATTQRVRKRRKADDSAGGDNIDEDPPARPSAADAGAIRGNTTVSPSLPAQSKRRKPNAAGDAKSPRAGRATPKAKSGGRNTGVRAKNAVKEQLHSEGGDTGTVKEEEAEEEQKPVVINRAPVLQLWGACVARVLFRERDVAWKTCLSIGMLASVCLSLWLNTVEARATAERRAGSADGVGHWSLSCFGCRLLSIFLLIIAIIPKNAGADMLTHILLPRRSHCGPLRRFQGESGRHD